MKRISFLFIFLFLISTVISPKITSAEEALEYLLFQEVPQIYIASAKAEHIEDAPACVFVITGDEMRNRGYRSIFDLLKDLPGMTWENQIGNEKNGAPVIRGLVYQKRLKILLNGMDIADKAGSGWGWDHRMPIEGIERVEYILGPYASLYGRNSFSGVLNIVTKSGEDLNGGEVTALYGTWNRMQGSAVYGKKVNNWDVYLSIFKNYSQKGQDLTNDFPDRYSREARLAQISPVFGTPVEFVGDASDDFYLWWDSLDLYFKTKNDNGLQFDIQYNKTKWPQVGTFLTPLFYCSPTDADTEDTYLNTRIKYDYTQAEKWSSSTMLQYQKWEDEGKLNYIDDLYRWYVGKTRAWQLEQKFQYEIADWNNIYLGISYEKVKPTPVKGSDRVNPAQKPDLSGTELNNNYTNFTLQDEIQIKENLSTVIGAMYERSNTYDDVIIPRFSTIWDVTAKTTLKFLYGGGYITPDLIVLNDQIIPDGSIKGSANLKPEKLTSYEINLIHKFNDKTRFSSSVYVNEVKDVIFLQNDSSLPAPFTSIYRNSGEKETRGFELNFDYGITDTIKLFTSYGYVEGFTKTADGVKTKRLPLAAKQHIKAGINMLLLNGKLNLYIHDLYVGQMDTWTTNTLPGYNLVDINLLTTPLFHKEWHLSLGINNVFDKIAFDPPYLAQLVSPDRVPLKRRHWTLQIGRKF